VPSCRRRSNLSGDRARSSSTPTFVACQFQHATRRGGDYEGRDGRPVRPGAPDRPVRTSAGS
jgi:hypothetical protein